MDELCRTCNALCCRYFCFEIEEPDTYEEFDDIRWYLLHEGITVHIDEGDWYISIENPCKALGPDKHCRIYNDRPLICRNYSLVNCDQTPGDYEYDALFKTPEDIERYARKILGDTEYEKAQARARAKARRKGTKKKVRSKA